MLKQRSRSLRRACQTSNVATKQTTTVSYIFKSILLTAVCFCFFKPCAHAQKYNLDQHILMELMESRTDGATKVFKGISNNTQLVSVLIPTTVLAVGLIDNDKMTIKKG